MKIAFIGHTYHKKTSSHKFIIELLYKYSSNIDYYYDDAWNGGASIDYKQIAKDHYDQVVVWQITEAAENLANLLDNNKLSFFPMYDACHMLGNGYWTKLGHIKIISFSSTLYTKLKRLGCNVFYMQYYPNPNDYLPINYNHKLSVFYWQRRKVPTISSVLNVLGSVDHVHWHRAFDPGFVSNKELVVSDDSNVNKITISDWFENKSELEKLLSAMNIYIAPRDYEGIGMSFLEAMARGQCVISLDNPTMSEYISHNCDGVLIQNYESTKLDLSPSVVNQIGKNARNKIFTGYKIWEKEYTERLPNIIFNTENNYLDRYDFLYSNSSHNKLLFEKEQVPLITVAVVCYNAKDDIEKTIKSIINQNYNSYELIVVDGGSIDGTLDIISKYSKFISTFITEADKGPYDAMNKAALLAKGEWIIYINAGDVLYTPESIFNLSNGINSDVDFVVGNHIYSNNGIETFNKVNDFDYTWSNLLSGNLSNKWKQGIPCHQSTLTRKKLIVEFKYDTYFEIAADHDFMYRMKYKGSKFSVVNEYISIYYGGGISAQKINQCIDEWMIIAKKYTSNKLVNKFYLPRKAAHTFAYNTYSKIKRFFYKFLGQDA